LHQVVDYFFSREIAPEIFHGSNQAEHLVGLTLMSDASLNVDPDLAAYAGGDLSA